MAGPVPPGGALKRKPDAVEAAEDEDTSRYGHIIPLGAGSEVGRSCIIFRYQ
jgi:cleavage and polyadenylation specificity factor subunit 3